MKAILARQYNGSYSLLRYKPIIERVAGTDHTDIYVKPGDPIGYRNMCAASVAVLLSIPCAPLTEVGQTKKIEVFMIPGENMTTELRKAIIEAQHK